MDDQPTAPLESWPSLDLSVDPKNFVVVDCNQAFVATLGVSPLGQYLVSLIDPEYRGAAIKALESLSSRKEIKRLKLRFLRAGRDSVPVMVAAHGARGSNENLALIRLVCQNTTPLKQIANIEAFSEMLSTKGLR